MAWAKKSRRCNKTAKKCNSNTSVFSNLTKHGTMIVCNFVKKDNAKKES